MAKYFKKQVMAKLSIVLDKKIVFIRKKVSEAELIPDLSDDAYEVYKDTYASVEYLKSDEVYMAKADTKINTVKFIVWHRKDITNDMRIHYDGGIYEIKGQRPLDRHNTYLLITGEWIQHE